MQTCWCVGSPQDNSDALEDTQSVKLSTRLRANSHSQGDSNLGILRLYTEMVDQV